MPFKDKDRQRKANKQAAQRRRDKRKGMTQDSHTVIPDSHTQNVIPKIQNAPDCQCMHCQQSHSNKSKHIINHGAYKTAGQLADNEINRVSLPGDVDYPEREIDGTMAISKPTPHTPDMGDGVECKRTKNKGG